MIANELSTQITRLQAFIYTINHVIDKHFQGFINFVTCLPGCFCCFRVRVLSKELDYWGCTLKPGHPDYFYNYCRKAEGTLDRNLLLMGEDRWRTSLLIFRKTANEKIAYFPYALADTYAPEELSQYIKQQRRWFISTVANQIIPCTRPSVWRQNMLGVFTELVSIFGSLSMPVICVFLWVVIVLVAWKVNNAGFLMACAFMALIAFTCYIHGRLRHVMYSLNYLLLSPMLMVFLPVYSLTTFRSDSWGTRGANQKIITLWMILNLIVIYAFVAFAVGAIVILVN